MLSSSQKNSMDGHPTQAHECPQEYTCANFSQSVSSNRPGPHFEGAVPNSILNEQPACVNPNLLSQDYYPLSLIQSTAISTATPITSNLGTPTAPAQVPPGRKFKCEICNEAFDRASRVESCRNNHLGQKPYKCLGRCGTYCWYVAAACHVLSA